MHFYSRQQSGSLLSRMMNDVSYIQNLVNDEFFVLVSSAVQVIVMIYLLFTLNWQMTLLCACVLPVVIAVYLIMKKKIYHFSKKLQELYETLYGKIQENIASLKIIQAETIEERKDKETVGFCDKLADVSIKQTKTVVRANWVVTVFTQVPLLIILWCLGGWFVIEGKLTLGALLAFIQYLFGILGPVTRFFGFNLNLQARYAALDRIYEILDKPPDIADAPGAVPLETPITSIRFAAVSLHFTDPGNSGKSIAALSGVNLEIKRGEKIGIVGSSGSGKTSLANLILRFYQPTAGDILVNGKNIPAYTMQSLRSRIAYMPQEEFLFNDTVKNNITLGREYSRAEIDTALKAAYAYDFVYNLADGMDTVIGERGVTLSGGQRQRLSLARVFLKKPDLFIFDEAFSALDTESEALIFKALQGIVKEAAALFIAHRFSFLQLTDRILVFSDGRLIEDGTLDNLVKDTGLFSRLFSLQAASSRLQQSPEPNLNP
jgi:subfamily B ATP-binding cassette protein MsbA